MSEVWRFTQYMHLVQSVLVGFAAEAVIDTLRHLCISLEQINSHYAFAFPKTP